MSNIHLKLPQAVIDTLEAQAQDAGLSVEDFLSDWITRSIAPPLATKIYTVGHSNVSSEDFVSLLQKHDIKVLVDVRSSPFSQYNPQFNQHTLKNVLNESGIDYRFAGEFLGGRPKQEDLYETVPDKTTKRQNYLKQVQYDKVMLQDWYRLGIQRLLDITRETQAGKVAIMCSEANPQDCHRHHLIARSLLDNNVKVVQDDIQVIHILRDGELQVVKPEAFEVHSIKQERLF